MKLSMLYYFKLCESSRLMNKRAASGEAYKPTEYEHIANVITHGLWILPSIAAVIWMIHLSTSLPQLISAFLYGVSLVCLFSVSTIFHALAYWKDKFRKLHDIFHIGDRAVIYIFIAASYTPWLTLKEFKYSAAWILCAVWFAAMLGILYQYIFHERYKFLEIVFYIGLGVLPSIIILDMTERSGTREMALGGAVYIAGVLFFKSDGIIPFAHAVWHCFVFFGAVLHYNAVCKYLLGSQFSTSQHAVY